MILFDFSIAYCLRIDINIPIRSAYSVYVSVRYVPDCTHYPNVCGRHGLLFKWVIVIWLISFVTHVYPFVINTVAGKAVGHTRALGYTVVSRNIIQQQTTIYELSVDASSQLRHRSTRQHTHIKEHRGPDIASQTSRAAAGGNGAERGSRVLWCGCVDVWNSVSVVSWHRLNVHRRLSDAVTALLLVTSLHGDFILFMWWYISFHCSLLLVPQWYVDYP
jgi:hypothetical protein